MEAEPPKRKRCWLHFSLRKLSLLVMIMASQDHSEVGTQRPALGIQSLSHADTLLNRISELFIERDHMRVR